jgi:phosphoribosylamine--glycine ligase
MKILVIGSGGREHALAWKLAQSPLAEKVFVAPGNAGTAMEPGIENVAIAATDIAALKLFALAEKIDLTVVGPETPLAAGIVDLFREANLLIFGPSKACAQLEASKAFSKQFMQDHHIPTAHYAVFTEVGPAQAYIKKHGAPIVIKADGLAAGKGVVVAFSEQEALNAVEDMLGKQQFGNASAKIVVEEFLAGVEVSFIAMIDGKNILPMATSQDHKARDDGDQGPNTGGMGAYSPAPMATPEIEQIIIEKVLQPVIDGMAARGTPYTGFLYAGLMLTKNGPKVLEFNCRFGDPETQPIMMRLQSDFVQICLLGAQGKLNEATAIWDPRAAVGVVMASRNYPDNYPKGETITGLETVTELAKIFHAGTQQHGNQLVTDGGRVLCVTALGESLQQAQQNSYAEIRKIHWASAFYRNDIGQKGIEYFIK